MRLPPVTAVERALVASVLRLPPALLRRVVGPAPRAPEGYEMELQTQVLNWLARVTKQPGMHELPSLADARANLDHAGPLLDVQRVPGVGTYDRTLPGATGPRRARVYTPRARPDAAPCLLFFHGGAFVAGSIESHDGVCRALAHKAGVVVVSFDYRLAPEHRAPAGLEDCIAATRWLLENAASLGVDPRAVAIGGDSAGGHMAAGVAIATRDDARRPAFQLLVYPATDATRTLPSHRHFAQGYFLPEAQVTWALGHYLPHPGFATDPRVSPLLAPDVARTPRALVLTAGFDPLRDEGKAYADKLRAAGVSAEYVCAEGLMHGYLNMSGKLREPARMVDLIAARLADALSRPARPEHASAA